LSVYFAGDYNEQKNLPLTLTMTLTKAIQFSPHISFKHTFAFPFPVANVVPPVQVF